ncbi:MAG: glycoside hydrolase family 88 protein [Lachnospiraceae bacterium]|jgi:unsaturated rhamnogalacturonyl hydrolase
MMKLEYDRDQILGAIGHIVDKTETMDLTWDWPCGVAYYGLCEAYKTTGDQKIIDFLKNWVDGYIELGLPSWNVNTCAMGHCLITLYEATGDLKYWEILMQKVDYLENDALRFGDHVLQHTVSSNNDFPEQCWADTLFMAAFLLLRVGAKLRNLNPDDPKDKALLGYSDRSAALIDDALNQYYWHIQYLQDPSTGFWYHSYNNILKNHMSGFYWGRANAWAAYTMSQVKKNLHDWYLYPQCMDVECSLRDQLAALKLVQTENGLWRTLVNDEEAYEEVSASAGIAAAMVENGNPLHTKYVQKALSGILANVTEDGRVLNVSGGTAVMKDRDGYLGVPRAWIQGWGQGLALAFLTAVLRQEQKQG